MDSLFVEEGVEDQLRVLVGDSELAGCGFDGHAPVDQVYQLDPLFV